METEDKITFYKDGNLYTLPIERVVQSFSLELGVRPETVRQFLMTFVNGVVKDMHLPLEKGDILLNADGYPASLIEDMYLFSEEWVVIGNTTLVKSLLKM